MAREAVESDPLIHCSKTVTLVCYQTASESFKLADIYPSFIAEVWDFEQNETDGLSYERLTTGSNKTAKFHCSKDGARWIEQIVKYWETGRSGCPKCTESRRIRNKTL